MSSVASIFAATASPIDAAARGERESAALASCSATATSMGSNAGNARSAAGRGSEKPVVSAPSSISSVPNAA